LRAFSGEIDKKERKTTKTMKCSDNVEVKLRGYSVFVGVENF